jgi:hypothetical protein
MEKRSMQFRILALAVAGILSAPSLARAEAATDLDEVVVTATRTRVALADSLFPAQVIDHDDDAGRRPDAVAAPVRRHRRLTAKVRPLCRGPASGRAEAGPAPGTMAYNRPASR